MNLFNFLLVVIIMFITIKPIIIPNFSWDGLVFIKPENLSKTELVEKFKELSSSNSLKDLKNKKDEIKEIISVKEFLKTYYSKTLAFIFKFKNLITKIALFTILIKYIRKIKFLNYIFKIINYILLSTLGIFISDIYGLKEIIAEIEYNWMIYVNFIHETRIYKSLIKIFHVIMDEDKTEVVKDESEIIKPGKVSNSEIDGNKESYDFPSSGREFETEKIFHDKISERNTRENWFELKTYFLVGVSIICLALTYVYWDSIIGLFKSTKPGDGSNPIPPIVEPKINSPTEIQMLDLSNLKLDDLSLISEHYQNLCENMQMVGDKLRNKINYYKLFKDSFTNKLASEKTNELINLFENLKAKQGEAIHVFNKLIQLNKTAETDIFKYNDRTRMLTNLNSIQKLLGESKDIVPDYNLNLDGLPHLYLGDYTPLGTEQSTSNVKALNEEVEKSWTDSSSSGSKTPTN
jgi:hypothetical protein